MKVITCYKLSPDSQDLQVNPDSTLSLERAEWVIGDFDLVAIEAGAQIAAKMGAEHVGLSVGPMALENKKARKNALSRGMDSLKIVMDDSLEHADTNMTAHVLCETVKKLDDCKLVICGEGSSDYYYRQAGLQLGELLGWAAINGIDDVIEVNENSITAERVTEDAVQTITIPLPAVLTVTADYAEARIPKMKDILGAGKKPVEEIALADLGTFTPKVDVMSVLAPENKARKGIVIEGPLEEAVNTFVEYMTKEGYL